MSDITIPDTDEIHRYVDSHFASRLSEVVENHVDRAVKRIWTSVVGLVIVVVLQSIYIAYVAGSKVQQLESNTMALASLASAHVVDEENLASINANLNEINLRLARIENYQQQKQ